MAVVKTFKNTAKKKLDAMFVLPLAGQGVVIESEGDGGETSEDLIWKWCRSLHVRSESVKIGCWRPSWCRMTRPKRLLRSDWDRGEGIVCTHVCLRLGLKEQNDRVKSTVPTVSMRRGGGRVNCQWTHHADGGNRILLRR